ncbi:MAG: DNA-binding protein [Spirulinaceae cyanobacterium]
MTAITINLSDSQYQKLQNLASVYGVTVEVLLKASLDDWLNGQNDDFTNAADYILNKNSELYKRLA